MMQIAQVCKIRVCHSGTNRHTNHEAWTPANG